LTPPAAAADNQALTEIASFIASQNTEAVMRDIRSSSSRGAGLAAVFVVALVVFIHLTVLVLVGCRPERSPQHAIGSKAKQTHDVVVTSVSVPSSCVKGDTVRVTVALENRGNSTEAFQVTLTDVTEGKEIGRKSLTLSAAGEGGIDAVPDLIVTGEDPGDYFGGFAYSGDVNGDGYDDLLVAGASRFNQHRGRLYLYCAGPDMDDRADKVFTGESVENYFGEGASLGDVNGDGYADVIAGAPGYSNWQGRVYLFYGGPDMDTDVDVILDGERGTQGWFGCHMTVGDVNRDGCDDILVSATLLNDKKGRVYLFYGGNPMGTAPGKIFDGENAGDYFGQRTSIGTDVDGDKHGDVLIGTRWWPGGRRRGHAYLYYGAPNTDMDAVCDVVFEGENEEDEFAAGVDLFDIDGDGHGDVVISARKWPSGNMQGRVYLYWGSSRATMDNVADVLFTGEADTFSTLGGDHVVAGYVNDDKYGDIVVPAYGYYQFSGHGRTHLFYGATKSSIDNILDQGFTGEGPQNLIMYASVADFNGDNCGDIAVGGWGYPNGTNQGRVWLYYGRPPSSTDITLHWDTTNASVGEYILGVKTTPVANKDRTMRSTKTITVKVQQDEKHREGEPHPGDLQKGPAKGVELQQTVTPSTEKPTKSLTLAAVGGDIHQVQLCLGRGADINEKTISGDTALHYAIKYRHREVAELLIAKGADVNSRNRDRETPAHLAIKTDQREVLDLLVAKGASVSPVHVAAYRGDLAAIREPIKKKVSIKVTDEGGLTLLHAAASGGQKEVVAYLLEKGANVNACDRKKQTPLFCAAAAGHKEVVNLLLAKEAAVNPPREPDRWTPLYAAVSAGRRDVVETLLSKGGDANAKALTGNTPLHSAALKGDRDLTELLTVKGADLNAAKASSGNTPLHLAVAAGHAAVVELLATKGTRLNIKNSDGFTPLHYAVSASRLSWWETRVGDSSTPNDLAIAKLLVTHGADVNTKSNDGATPLSLALNGGPTEIVDLLRKHGAKE
jgi:cytohesin